MRGFTVTDVSKFVLSELTRPANPAAHYGATGPITEAAVIRKRSEWPFAEAAKKHSRNTLTKN